MTHPASTAARNLQTLHICMPDLDVFGAFAVPIHQPYLYRTGKTPAGRLAGTASYKEKEDILERQAAVRELAPELKFRQRFRILGLLHKGKAADETELKAWAASPGYSQEQTLACAAGNRYGYQRCMFAFGRCRLPAGKHVGSNLDPLCRCRVCLYRKDYQDTSRVRQETADSRNVPGCSGLWKPAHAMPPAEKH